MWFNLAPIDAQVNGSGQDNLNWTSSSFLPPLTQDTAEPAANDRTVSMIQGTGPTHL